MCLKRKICFQAKTVWMFMVWLEQLLDKQTTKRIPNRMRSEHERCAKPPENYTAEVK